MIAIYFNRYKWTRASPYSPDEQVKIRTRDKYFWYKYNYNKLSYTPPEEWKFFVGDQVQILAGKDKGKQGEVVQVTNIALLNAKYTFPACTYNNNNDIIDDLYHIQRLLDLIS